MPRPKRLKVAPSAPRVQNPAKTAPTVQLPPRGSIEPFNRSYDVSDQEEGPGVSTRDIRRSNVKARSTSAANTQTNAGRNMRGSERVATTRGLTDDGSGDNEVLSERENEGLGMDDTDLELSSPVVEIGRKERGTPGVENSVLAMGNFRRRPRQQSILGRAAPRARSSSMESNVGQDGRRTVSAMVDSNNRPRQPSLTGRNTGRVRSSSIGFDRGTPGNLESVLALGNFKRRARQPSILGTAQKARQQRPTYEDEDEDEEFNPDDESTPLNLSKARMINSSSASSSSNPKKRKLSAAQAPQSSPIMPPPNRRIDDPSTAHNDESDQSDELSSQNVPLPSIEAASFSGTPEPVNEIMAPPQSSSSSPTPESPPTYRAAQRLRAQREANRGGPRLRDRTPPMATQDSPISSPPSLTHSPNIHTSKQQNTRLKPRRQSPPASTFSTAQLQTLLPRRRRRQVRDQFDIISSGEEVDDVSGLATDEDELTIGVEGPSRRPGNVVTTLFPPKKATKAKPAHKSKRAVARRTYGSRGNAVSDKENEEDADFNDSLGPLPDNEADASENSQELEKRIGKELKKAAQKFAEVDKWELQFEEVTASSSSPMDAR